MYNSELPVIELSWAVYNIFFDIIFSASCGKLRESWGREGGDDEVISILHGPANQNPNGPWRTADLNMYIAVAGRLFRDERVRGNENNNNMPESPHHGTRMCRLQVI